MAGFSGAQVSIEKKTGTEMPTENVSAENRQKPKMRLGASVRPKGKCLAFDQRFGTTTR